MASERRAVPPRQNLAALYGGTASLVHGLALRILSDRSTAEEVIADVYLQVWRQAVRFGTSRCWLAREEAL